MDSEKHDNTANDTVVSDAPPRSLSGKVIKGGLWVAAIRICDKLLSLVRVPILAWWLDPKDFGLVSVAVMAISLIETFTQPGLAAALVRKKGDVRPYLNTVWTVSAVRCVCIWLLLRYSAGYVALFFKAPQAEDIVRVFSICVLLAGLRNPAVLYFQRDMDFRKQYLYDFSISLAGSIVSITAAFLLKNVWALVLGSIAGNLVRLIMSYVLCPFMPRIRMEKDKLSEMFKYGKWMLGSSILGFLTAQGDNMVVGKVLGITMLGLYQMAYMLSDLPAAQMSQVIGHVTFPAYSFMQNDPQRMKTAYRKVLFLVACAATMLSGLLFSLADEFVTVILSPKWREAVPILQILVWAGLLRAMRVTTEPIFNAIGKPALNAKSQFIQLLFLAACIFPLARQFGVLGVGAAVLISQIAATSYALAQLQKTVAIASSELLRILGVPFIAMLLMMVAILGGKCLVGGSSVMLLSIGAVAGVAVYSGFVILSEKLFGFGVLETIKGAIQSLRRAG